MAMARNYGDAVKLLNSLQSNSTIIDAIRKSGQTLNLQAIPEMVEWCRRIGYKPSDFNALNAIHIAGTKGKGSTAAFVSSILTQFINHELPDTKPFSKVGLYTSPHLTSVCERIQINGKPLSEEQFAHYFFEVWDRLEDAARAAGEDPTATKAKPVYFRYLTLMAFHTYISEQVDVAVIECGIGGAYDSTNVIESPALTAITSLGIDHVGVLGSTIDQIAWHKAGIMKKDVRCFTPVDQPVNAKEVLEKVARERGCIVEYVKPDPEFEDGAVKLGLQGDFQKINASLARTIAREWLRQRGYKADETVDSDLSGFRKREIFGLEHVQWPGRCESRTEPGIQWCIDGAHTLESIKLAGEWFASRLITNPISESTPTEVCHPQPRFLLFNQQGLRDASSLATALYKTLTTALEDPHPFTHVIFCTNTTFKDTGYKPDLVSVNTNASDVGSLKVQHELAATWRQLDPIANVEVVRTIEEAVDFIREFANAQQQDSSVSKVDKEVTALVTGSLHLVGGFLAVFENGAISEASDSEASLVNRTPPQRG